MCYFLFDKFIQTQAILTNFTEADTPGADIKVEIANFCAVMDTLLDQDELEVANFCTVTDILVDEDA